MQKYIFFNVKPSGEITLIHYLGISVVQSKQTDVQYFRYLQTVNICK